MASKYAKLKGKIPVKEPTERDVALTAELQKVEDLKLADLTDQYNTLATRAAELAADAKAIKVQLDAREIIIRKRLSAQGADGVSINGYTWTETVEPYPVCQDIPAIVAYFQEHDPDQLQLKSTELASRLKAKVKEESQTGELQIVTIPGENGEEDRTEVRSQVPGVLVFLKSDLSRVKASKVKE